MNNRAVWFGLAAALIAALLAAGFGYHEHDALDASRRHVVTNELRPIAALLRENQALIQELQSEPGVPFPAGFPVTDAAP